MRRSKLKLKICGMREPKNVLEVASLELDYMGFIFYPKSPRFIESLNYTVMHLASLHYVEPIPVFADASVTSILHATEIYPFTIVQLHGHETPETCATLRENGLNVIKAISLSDSKDLEVTKLYRGCCDLFLFDTKSEVYGGSGNSYDWNILQEYDEDIPFFLSGGIGPKDAKKVLAFHHPRLFGIDINSQFEIKPALKDVRLIKSFIDRLNL
jgi:phosphoribosylanthranilate isomerase